MRITTTILLLTSVLVTWAQPARDGWPLFRGDQGLTGRADVKLPDSPVLLWSYAGNARSVSSPVVQNGIVCFGDNEGVLHAVRISDGRRVWKYETNSVIEGAPMILDGSVIFGVLDGRLFSLDLMNGAEQWIYETDNQVNGSANFFRRGDGTTVVMVGSYDHYLHAVDASNGKMLWMFETYSFINGTPAVAGKMVVFGGCDGMLRIADPATGLEIRSNPVDVYIAASPALYDGTAFVGDYDGTLYAMDLNSGATLWKVPGRDHTSVIVSVPAVTAKRVVVGSEDMHLGCYETDSGKELWSYRTNGRITGSAVIAGNRVLFGSRDSNIYMLSLDKGEQVWQFDAGRPISSTPAVDGNRFFVLTEDGRLMAFGAR